MLVNGVWSGDWHPVQKQDDEGRFVRQRSSFRTWVTPDGRPGPEGQPALKAEPGRFRLYVALICPWASRVLLVRALKKLHHILPVTVVEPELTDFGWRFHTDPDPELGASHMHELYTASDPLFTGRATVPVLWDTQEKCIVNNESADLIRMLDSAFDAWTDVRLNLRPSALEAGIEALNQAMYRRLNNGVYRAGFASTQLAYQEAVEDVFGMLDDLETMLSDGRPYLLGDRLTESDIRLFVTAARFDVAYHGAFKTNRRRFVDYPHLLAWLQRLIQRPEVAETVSLEHIKRGYYSIKALNPTGIVPEGPVDPFGLAEQIEAAA